MKKVIYRTVEDGRPEIDATPESILEALYEEIFGGSLTEKMVVFWVSSQSKILGYEVVAEGSEGTAITSLKNIMRSAIHLNASAIIFAHNHPNEHEGFTKDDLELTSSLRKACKSCGIGFQDHLLFAGAKVFSMVDMYANNSEKSFIQKIKNKFSKNNELE